MRHLNLSKFSNLILTICVTFTSVNVSAQTAHSTSNSTLKQQVGMLILPERTAALICIDNNKNQLCDLSVHHTTQSTSYQEENVSVASDNGVFNFKGNNNEQPLEQQSLVAQLYCNMTPMQLKTSLEQGTLKKVKPCAIYNKPRQLKTKVISATTSWLNAMYRTGKSNAQIKYEFNNLTQKNINDLLSDYQKSLKNQTKNLNTAFSNFEAIKRKAIFDSMEMNYEENLFISQINTHLLLENIKNIVVIYAENRSFDNLYGSFPGAEGLSNGQVSFEKQVDELGKPYHTLPAIWEGVNSSIAQSQTTNLMNAPFSLENTFNIDVGQKTRDLDHSFFIHQMQINNGLNNKFAAYSDAGGLVMGYYKGSDLKLWQIAKQYSLADHFFMGAFGGSFLNHMWLICACAPVYPMAEKSAPNLIASTLSDGFSLRLKDNFNTTEEQPKFVGNGKITPINNRYKQHYAVNTMQPPYQPSANPPNGNNNYADSSKADTLPAQSQLSIGDLLSKKHITWAWYSGSWNAALQDGMQDSSMPRKVIKNPEGVNFQPHHQPFNYFASFAPNTAARSSHLKDYEDFIKLIRMGKLPAVSFYKPQGNLNQHAGYADVISGDNHIAALIGALKQSKQWPHMLIIVTYDEHGGWWDHVSPPKADVFGPGTRIPAIVISPYAKKSFVDHRVYDTTSILSLITKRFNLPELDGLKSRKLAYINNGLEGGLGDLTISINFEQH